MKLMDDRLNSRRTFLNTLALGFVMILLSTQLLWAAEVKSCSVFAASDGTNVFAGNNEDMPPSVPQEIWFVPPREGKFGYVAYGDLSDHFSQGGMNDQGLFFDGTASPKLAVTPNPNGCEPHAMLLEEVLANCATVQQALDHLAQYNPSPWMSVAQLFFADKYGDAAILEGDIIWRKEEKPYLVVTNFYHSNPELGNSPCRRYDIINSMMENGLKVTLEYFVDMAKAAQPKSPTVYTTIGDLVKGKLYLYYRQDFEHAIEFDLTVDPTARAGRYPMETLVAGIMNDSAVKGRTEYDVLIKNTHIIDGTGNISFKGDVAIKADKIVAIRNLNSGKALRVIDGTGLVTCPGFIDPHSHGDFGILKYSLAENLVMQGVTTFLGGNCGISPAPTKKKNFEQWLSKIENKGISINYAPLVGHNAIRSHVMGKDFKREAKPKEIELMKNDIHEAMRAGAFGFSTMLDPSPGEYASLEEIVALAEVAQEHNGIYFTHHRHHQSNWASDNPKEYGYGIFHGPDEDTFVGRYRGLLEAIEIGRRASIPVHISHLINVFRIPQPHPDYLEKAASKATLEIIEKAKKEGLRITFDVIAANLEVLGPIVNSFVRSRNVALEWLNQYKTDEFVEKLKDEDFREKIKRVHHAGRLKLGMIQTLSDPYWMDRLKIIKCTREEFLGKTVAEISRLVESSPLDTVFDIVIEDPKTIWVQFLDERDTQVARKVFFKHPESMPCTDVSVVDTSETNKESSLTFEPPEVFGMYAEYIRTFVLDNPILSLEEAIKKATYLPAQMLGLEDRGILKPGNFADIVVVNLDEVRMKGVFLNPAQPPEGIEYVLVNGRITYENMKHTGEMAGRVLRKQQSRD